MKEALSCATLISLGAGRKGRILKMDIESLMIHSYHPINLIGRKGRILKMDIESFSLKQNTNFNYFEEKEES